MGEPLPPNLKVIGRYTLLRELRRERHTVSYEAVDPVMNRSLIVKAVQLVRPGGTATQAEVGQIEQAFVRQAQAAGRLHHPHIVTVFDAGRGPTHGYLVIERVAGRPLHELLARGLRPSFVQCATIAARICDALAYAHGQGVAHRHLGPQHVFLTADGSPKVAGFGGWIDAGVSGDEALAHTDTMLPYFDSEITPEVRAADARAAASLLYMMLTGRAPSSGGAGAVHAPTAASANRPQPVQWLRADAPAELASVVDGALDPATRTARSAEALRDALTAWAWTQRTEAGPAGLGMPFPEAMNVPPPTRPPHPATIPATAAATASLAAQAAAGANRLFDAGEVGAPPSPDRGAAPAPKPRTDGRLLPPVASFSLPLQPRPRPPGQPAPVAPAAAPPPAAVPPPWQIPGLTPAQSTRIRQRLIDHRFTLVAVSLVLGVAVVLGLTLGRITGRHGPAAADTVAVPAPGDVPPLPPPPVDGVVQFEVAPWGEVLVDNKPIGVTPPLQQLTLSPGRHLIEIRHPDRPSWTGQIEIETARPLVIRHSFD